MVEIWKDIPNYEGIYQISNYGNVRRLNKWDLNRREFYENIHNIKLQSDTKGYLHVDLSKNQNVKRRDVHRLVAEAFIPNPENKPEINHIDGNKKNNRVDNLEWCTRSENLLHLAYKLKCRIKPVLQYDLNGNFIREWDGARMAAEECGFSRKQITAVCGNKVGRKSANNFLWKYKTDENYPKKIKPYIRQFKKKSVYQYDLNKKLIKEWSSITDASKILKIEIGDISACCKHKPQHKTAGGYIWEYKNKEKNNEII